MIYPPDPAGDLVAGPAEDWRPGAAHLLAIKKMADWLVKVGIPEKLAPAWAFELWKLTQRAGYHQ